MSRNLVLYHGSENIIEEPKLELGNPNNDFGQGFYCTQYEDLAKEWACTEMHGGYANKYVLDMTGLKVLDLTSDKYGIFNWLAVLLTNRSFPVSSDLGIAAQEYIKERFNVSLDGYDVVMGYRADDTHFSIAKDFLQNKISVKELKKILSLNKDGNQIALISNRAFEHLKFVGYEKAEREINYPLRRMRDERDRMQYFMKKNELSTKAIYMFDLVRKGNKLNDSRL